VKLAPKARAAVGSLAFLVVAPGVVAGLVPWLLTGWEARGPLPYWIPLWISGLVLIAAGVFVLVQAFVRFVVEGLGTPAPVAPTERLVVGGLYRHVRNPMYLAVAAIILGQALALGQVILVPYAAAFAVAVAAFVRWYEEPTLQRQFGEEYETYRLAVPGWWPRREPLGRGILDVGRGTEERVDLVEGRRDGARTRALEGGDSRRQSKRVR
jgi:protein-S-isoprenylcysteine O-methyltransferase Ste14